MWGLGATAGVPAEMLACCFLKRKCCRASDVLDLCMCACVRACVPAALSVSVPCNICMHALVGCPARPAPSSLGEGAQAPPDLPVERLTATVTWQIQATATGTWRGCRPCIPRVSRAARQC